MKTLCLLMALCLWVSTAPARAEQTTTTVLIYMCGTDLESDGEGCASEDIKEIIKGMNGASSSVRVLIETGGAKDWSYSGVSDTQNQLHQVTASGLKTVENLGRRNMGEADTLKAFIAYGYERYASDRMILSLWDHGGGPLDGVCFDENFRDDGLTLEELTRALSGGVPKGEKLDLIAFDACLMGSVEVAAAVMDHASVFVGSEEMVPGTGFDYTPWLAALCEAPHMDNRQVGQAMAEALIEDNAGRFGDTATLSVIDCEKLPPLLSALSAFGDALNGLMETQFSNVSRARASIASFGEFVEEDASDLVDIFALCEAFSTLAPAETKAIRAALNDAVLYQSATQDIADFANGLSVYMPYSTTEYFSQAADTYENFDFMGEYASSVSAMTVTLAGSSYSFTGHTPQNTFTNSAAGVSGSLWASASGSLWDGLSGDAQGGAPTGLWGGLSGDAQGGSAVNPSGGGTSFSFGSGMWDGLGDAEQQASAGQADSMFIDHIWDGLAESAGQTQGSIDLTDVSLWSGLAASGEAYYQPEQHNPNIWSPEQTTDTESVASQAASYFSSSSMQLQAIYTIQLTREEMDHLSSASAILTRRAPNGTTLRLGMLGTTTINWSDGMIYSLFDGQWPLLNDQMVCMYETERAEGVARALIPAKVNGIRMYLLVSIDERGGARILGATQGYDSETGMPIRGYITLEEGMTIVPLFDQVTDPDDGSPNAMQIEGAPITVGKDGLRLTRGRVEPGMYQFGFALEDIYGNTQYTSMIDIVF